MDVTQWLIKLYHHDNYLPHTLVPFTCLLSADFSSPFNNGWKIEITGSKSKEILEITPLNVKLL